MSNGRLSNMASFQIQSPPAAPPSLRADAELVLAAIRRIETAITDDRAGLPADLLRAHLRAMGDTVAQARLELTTDAEYGVRTVDIGSMLSQLADGIAAAARIVDPPVADAAAGSRGVEVAPPFQEQVPTVSNVVSQLGRSSAALMPLADFSARGFGSDEPSIANLQDMVRALGEHRPEPEHAAFALPDMAAWTSEFAPETLDDGSRSEIDVRFEPSDASITAEVGALDAPSAAMLPMLEPEAEVYGPGRPAITEAVAETAVIAPGVMPEPDLLSSFERMQDIPFLPPEEGSAVIFPPREATADESRAAETAQPETPPHSPAMTDAAPAAPEQDVATFLFGSTESEPEPSEFLLDFTGLAAMSIEPRAKAIQNSPDAEPMSEAISVQAPEPMDAPATADAAAASRDPLAALRTMSDVERIALFG